MQNTTCCFIGHKEIRETEDLRRQLYAIIEKLIVSEKVDTFLFGSNSQFNSLCYTLVTELKEKHPHIKRIYIRAEFPYIDNRYKSYLLERYEGTYYPEKLLNAGKAVYVERNCNMIDNSRFCVVYFQENQLPQNRKSGTKLALDYAIKKNRSIIILPFAF